jgi:hypothetical protein
MDEVCRVLAYHPAGTQVSIRVRRGETVLTGRLFGDSPVGLSATR